MEYFPFDFKVSPVYAYLHSSLLNTSSSPELLPLPSVLDLFFAVFKYLYALPPFSLSGQGSGNFSNENSCSHPESIFLYIKALHSFFTPLVKAHFRLCTSCTVLLYFLSSLHAVPPLGCCCLPVYIFALTSQCLTMTLFLTAFSFFFASSWTLLCFPQPISGFPLPCKPRTHSHAFICPEK